MISEQAYREMTNERERRVRRAEKSSGFKEGARLWKGHACKVSVTFYPTEQWWIEQPGCDPVVLTDEIWSQTSEILL